MNNFCILSIDGGGLRGVVPLTILRQVEAVLNKKIKDVFRLVAGTSTGGLIASAISIQNPDDRSQTLYNLDDVLKVYLERGKEIFPPRTKLEKLDFVHDFTHPKFDADGVKKVYKDLLKHYTINDCFNNIIVFSYDLNNNVPLIFKSRTAQKIKAQNALLYDVCRATSAAPTCLPSYEFYYPNDAELPERNCIDGGVYINNPTMGALAEYLKYRHHYSPEIEEDGKIDFDKIFILSVGTGNYNSKIKGSDTQHKGELFWVQHISDVMMKGVNMTTDYEMKEILKENVNYLRLDIDIDIEEHADMTNSSEETTNYLINKTNKMLADKKDLLEGFLKNLSKSK